MVTSILASVALLYKSWVEGQVLIRLTGQVGKERVDFCWGWSILNIKSMMKMADIQWIVFRLIIPHVMKYNFLDSNDFKLFDVGNQSILYWETENEMEFLVERNHHLGVECGVPPVCDGGGWEPPGWWRWRWWRWGCGPPAAPSPPSPGPASARRQSSGWGEDMHHQATTTTSACREKKGKLGFIEAAAAQMYFISQGLKNCVLHRKILILCSIYLQLLTVKKNS